MRGRPAPKRPSKPRLSASPADEALLRLPLDAERRVGEQVVEAHAGEPVGGEAVAELDVLEVLALHHQVAAADGVGLGVVLLAVALEARLRVELAQVVLGDAQHAAGAAGRVAEGAHDAGPGERLAVGLEEQVDHETDDLARRKVVAGGLVGRLVELLDLGLKAEVLDDLAGTLAEAGDVMLQVGGDVGGVVGELGKVEAAGVVEGLPGDVFEHRLGVGKLTALEALMPREHRGLGRLEHAVEAAEHGERQDHAAVLGGLVGAAQQIGDTPDEADPVAGAVHDRPPSVARCCRAHPANGFVTILSARETAEWLRRSRRPAGPLPARRLVARHRLRTTAPSPAVWLHACAPPLAAAGGGAARETEGKTALRPRFHRPRVACPQTSSHASTGAVPSAAARSSGSRGPVFRRPRLQKTVRVVAAHGIDAVRAYAVGGTAGGTSNGIVGSPVNGFGRFRPCPRRRAASAERARQR